SVVTNPLSGFLNCFDGSEVTSHGYNFSDDTTCNLTGTGDHQATGANPQLGALADNGGPTSTLLPATTSPLVDAIPTASCSADGASTISPLTDQRSLPRPAMAGCDIGSVELQAPPEVVIQPAFTG
ncbi:MAG TPA: choice-of-anchor Q domain-containing protein, partial [Gemmatimonadaceae bacterium]|nr:choice-of-anchor Q domain-containing protein [Gemmatimonadaceae bacterium]